jgi:hypothetical protein
VAVGTVKIHLAGPAPRSSGNPLTDWYLGQTRSSLTTRLRIKSGVNPPFDLDVRREAIALDKELREKDAAGATERSE